MPDLRVDGNGDTPGFHVPWRRASCNGDNRIKRVLVTGVLMLAFGAGCSPEVGSERWCNRMDETPKGDWTLNETKDYARYCLLGDDKDE